MVGPTINLINGTHIYVTGPTIHVGDYAFIFCPELLNNFLYLSHE